MSLCFSSDVYEKLFPEIQEGVGISGGCEKVIHFVRAVRRAIGDDAIVITVDFANAYNTRRRIDVWNSIMSHCKPADGVDLRLWARLFHWCYSVSSPLVLPASPGAALHSPLQVLASCEGLRQGANDASVAFSLSMQSIYKKSLKGLSEQDVAVNGNKKI